MVLVTGKPQTLLENCKAVSILKPLLKGTDIFSMLKHLVVDIFSEHE